MELISKQEIIDRLDYVIEHGVPNSRGLHQLSAEAVREAVMLLPPAKPEIIFCKDCAKHNKRIGDYEVLSPDGKGRWLWKDQACPLVEIRGKAKGHEFDYQFCAYAERKTE